MGLSVAEHGKALKNLEKYTQQLDFRVAAW